MLYSPASDEVGKPFKVVMTASNFQGRKLLKMLNAMARESKPWNPECAQCQNNPENQQKGAMPIDDYLPLTTRLT